MQKRVGFVPRLTGAIGSLVRLATITGPPATVSSRDLLNLEDWSGAENERRVRVLHQLYRTHAAEPAARDDSIIYRNMLPPDGWINEQLSARGEKWRVHGVDGFRCEIFDIADPDDRPAP